MFERQGAVVPTCARRPVDGLPYEFHRCDVRDPDAVAAMVGAPWNSTAASTSS